MRSEEFWDWFETVAPKMKEEGRGEFAVDRSETFRKMFEHLDKFERPVVIAETGCVRNPGHWKGDGCSTFLFDKYAQTHPGSRAFAVDINKESVETCRTFVSDCTKIECNDSVAQLEKWVGQGLVFDLLYLDSFDLTWTFQLPSQVHHVKELFAALPAIRNSTMVAVDDTKIVTDDWPQNKVIGKGRLVAEYAFEAGANLEFIGYQIGFTRMKEPVPQEGRQPRIEELVERAREHMADGRQLQADRLYRLIATLTPPPWTGKERVARGEAFAHFARLAAAMRRYGLAMDWYRRALECDPLATQYRIELATRCMMNMGAFKPARREALIATEIDPNDPAVWSAIGGIYADMLDVDDAIDAYDRQVETAKAFPEIYPAALLNRACLALDTYDYDLTREILAQIKGTKFEADGLHIEAMLAHREGRHEESIELFDKAISMGCRSLPLTHWNKSQPLQAIGRYKEAWKEHAWASKDETVPALYIPYKRFNARQWNGEPPPAIVHIHHEAGFGDNICMMRYLPLMVKRGYQVRYEADATMLSLAKRSLPEVEVVERSKDWPGILGIKDFDYQLPIGGLPHVFETDIDTVPWEGPYIKPDPELVETYHGQLPTHLRKIGLCWSAGVRTEMSIWMEHYGRAKCMRLEQLRPLLKKDYFISLQVGTGRGEIALVNTGTMRVWDLLPKSPTWDQTAALIENLDLVITVDTAVAHLAGAMGKPTWLMMQKDGSSWHFMCERPGASWNTRSPWYPSIRIFRQRSPGDWGSVVDAVCQALAQEKREAA